MLKKCSISILFVVSALLWFDADTTQARSSQPPVFNAGAPGMSSCGSNTCHGGELNTGPGNLEIRSSFGDNDDAYTDGSLIDVRVTVVDPNAVRFGFQMVAFNTAGESVGSFVTNDAENLGLQSDSQGFDYINHLQIPNPNSNIFDFQYQAPDQNIGPITFYAAGMAADGNGGPSNDLRYGADLEIEWIELSGIEDEIFASMAIFPNPSTNRQINITGVPFEQATIQIFDLQGKLHLTTEYKEQETIDLQTLSSGVYMLNVGNAEYQVSRKLVLR